MRPIPGLKLVFDEAVGGVGVGDAQKRFRQHHQSQALFGGESVGVEKILDAAKSTRAGADRVDQSLVRASIRASALAERPADASRLLAIVSSAGA